jgi:hypothetical protein
VSCDQVRESAAVAALTREPVDDEVRAHLADCAECREEVASLGALPPLLAQAREAVAVSDVPPPPALLDRLLAAAAEQRAARRRRTWRTALVAAAAALLLFGVPIGTWSIAERLNGTPAFSSSATSASGVTADVELKPADWGSTVSLSIRGVHPGTQCTVVVNTHDGGHQTAATWQASYSGTANVSGTTAASVSDVKSVDVVDQGTGQVLVTVPGPS